MINIPPIQSWLSQTPVFFTANDSNQEHMFKADAVSSGSPISQGVNIILITHGQTNCFQINYSLEFNMVDYWQKSYSLTIKNIFSEVGRYKYIVHATY